MGIVDILHSYSAAALLFVVIHNWDNWKELHHCPPFEREQRQFPLV